MVLGETAAGMGDRPRLLRRLAARALLPERAAYRVFDRIADQAWRRHGPSVRQLEANLARVRPGADPDELRELSKAGMRSYLRYYCDAFRLPGWSRERLVGTVRTVGDEPVRECWSGASRW